MTKDGLFELFKKDPEEFKQKCTDLDCIVCPYQDDCANNRCAQYIEGRIKEDFLIAPMTIKEKYNVIISSCKDDDVCAYNFVVNKSQLSLLETLESMGIAHYQICDKPLDVSEN